ncbi:MAG TPA: S1/P1 nuclease, partial [Tepidisphaeraceae bacterium]|nr:S1/P1 nuclease [Tepidisphaeraceae bacterium]
DLDRYEADGIHNDPRFTRDKMADALAVTDFMAWAKESNALAAHYAYLDGQLKGAVQSRDRSAPREDIPGVPPGYIANAELVSMHQVALAGHRLADLLNRLYDAK